MARAKGLCQIDSEHTGHELLLIAIVLRAARDAQGAADAYTRAEARRWLRSFAPEIATRLAEVSGDD